MRKIIFRGRKDYNNEWVYGNLIQFDWADFIVKYGSFEERQRVIPETVGQFTGLTDKNGKEIYEGDIITDGTFKYQVIFSCGAFLLEYIDKIIVKAISINMKPFIFLEIIGNIHDNPELLTDK